MTSDEIASVIGERLAYDLAPSQRVAVAEYIAENANGVARVAGVVLEDYAAGKINAAVPVLLARLRNGKHRVTPPHRPAWQPPEVEDAMPADELERRARDMAARLRGAT